MQRSTQTIDPSTPVIIEVRRFPFNSSDQWDSDCAGNTPLTYALALEYLRSVEAGKPLDDAEWCGYSLRIVALRDGSYSHPTGDQVDVPPNPNGECIEATWMDQSTGERADHADRDRGYYEAHLPSGARITSAERYQPGMLGDWWHEDDGLGGADVADSPEFHASSIRLCGGPRDGETVA